MFGTLSPTAVAAAAAGTQVRTALWGGGGGHQQCCPCPSLVQPPGPSPSWDSPHASYWTLSFQSLLPGTQPPPPACAAFSSPRPGCGCFSSSSSRPAAAAASAAAQHIPPAPRGVVSPDQPPTVGRSLIPAFLGSCKAQEPPSLQTYPFNTPPCSPTHFEGDPIFLLS